MRKIRTKSQIATIIVFIIAVIFLLTLISMNMSMVAQKKTAIDNIADSVGLQVASQLGSMANALKQELEIYGSESYSENVNWPLYAGPLATGIGVGLILTGGGAPLGIPLIILGASWMAGGMYTQFFTINPGSIEQMNIKLKSLSSLQQIIEMPVSGVLFGLADDNGLVTDTFDMDRDGSPADLIPRFVKWYNLRLNYFLRSNLNLSEVVKQFYQDVDIKRVNELPIGRFVVDANENWMAKTRQEMLAEGKLPEDAVRWWIDSAQPADGRRDLKVVDWFKNQLRDMLQVMRQYGYGINVTLDSGRVIIRNDGTDRYENRIQEIWIEDLEEFENEVIRGMYNMDFESLVQGVDIWLEYLRNGTNQDWYTRLGNMQQRAEVLLNVLTARKGEIENCLGTCGANSWECTETCQGSPCDWVQDCADFPCPEPEDPNKTCERCWSVAVKWSGCCGPWRNCGVLCGTACEPRTITCLTPTGGSRPCCEATNLEPYNRSPKGCYPNANIIDVYEGYNAFVILRNFITDIGNLRNLINTFYAQIDFIQKNSYDIMHEAFYLWTDRVGGVSDSPGQEVGHMVYATIEGVDPERDNFKLPNAYNDTRWDGWVAKIIKGVNNASGTFTLTVARFDEDTSKRGPLSRFWRFRFGRPGINADDEAFVRDIARRYRDYLNGDVYYETIFEPEPNRTEIQRRLRDILRNYGVVSRVRVNYGPGYAYRPEEGYGQAAQRNRDIYIVETSSNF